MSRREEIEAMLAEDPEDQFLRYSLAMEWQKEGGHEKSLDLLQSLMSGEPPLVAAFQMAGQHLVQAGRIDEARTVLRKGIEEARRQGESHAASEMDDLLGALDKAARG
jgi:thioredoxin-like negative regulator of GroEL